MAPMMLESEDHTRDAAFNKAMHGQSAEERAGFMAMMKKDPVAQKAAVDEYFKHWDNKSASDETLEIREVSSQRLRQTPNYHMSDVQARPGKLNMLHSQDSIIPMNTSSAYMPLLNHSQATTISQRISTNMAGVVHFTSAASHTEKAFTKQSLAMSII